MSSGTVSRDQQAGTHEAPSKAQPKLGQRGQVLQTPDTVRRAAIGLPAETRLQNVQALNTLLANTITLWSLYKKSHWQVSGPTFYQLHLLFDKHASEQAELIDQLAERVQTLGGVAVGMPHDVAETTTIARPPAGAEEPPVMIDRLLEAHELILKAARTLAKQADENDDVGTNDLLASEVIRVNELQAWFLAEHVVDSPTTAATPLGNGHR